jgi:hypothetical protein
MSVQTEPETTAPAPTVPVDGLLSIVVPCLNEELVVGEFVDWCWDGLREAGVEGEVVIVDSSTDRSPEIAEAHGARVLRVPRRGLGRAYIDALPHIRGEWVLMGDCDLTYDFRLLAPFVEELRKGKQFVMGSRFRGSIESGAMPRLHRFFGTPLTTWILNRLYGTSFTDIHCGMRGMTTEALHRIDLRSQGWEYASEMILKAARLRLDFAEVPVRFLRDREGRESHHKRAGWHSPWKAGWDNLKVMMLYAPEAFLIAPGLSAASVGLILSLLLIGGPVDVLGVGLSLNWQLCGVVLTTLGYSALQLGLLAKAHHELDPAFNARLRHWATFDRGAAAAAALILVGAVLVGILVVRWLSNGLQLETIDHSAVFGLLLVLLGFQTFAFTLLFEIVESRRRS